MQAGTTFNLALLNFNFILFSLIFKGIKNHFERQLFYMLHAKMLFKFKIE